MSLRSTLWTLILLLVCFSCGDPSSQVSGFRILGINKDSLFKGEQLVVTVSTKGLSHSNLRLFLHSEQLPIDSVASDKILVTLPITAESGVLRVYNGEEQASGNFRVEVVDSDVNFAVVNIAGYSPKQGVAGTILRIYAPFFPFRSKDLSVRINDVSLAITVQRARDSIDCLITDEVQDGPIFVRMFNQEVSIGEFDMSHISEQFLEESELSAVSVFLTLPMLFRNEATDPPRYTESRVFDHKLLGTAPSTRSDSIRAQFSNGDLENPIVYDVAFTESEWKNTISGTVHIRLLARIPALGVYDYRFWLLDAPFTKQNGLYKILLSDDSFQRVLFSFECQYFDPADGTLWTLSQYREDDGSAMLSMQFRVK